MFLRSSARTSSLTAQSQRSAATRTFATSRVAFAGKESKLNQEGRAEEAEAAKQEQLRKQKDGKQQWDEDLASDSESIAKADRGEFKDSSESIAQLQKDSAKLAQENKEPGLK